MPVLIINSMVARRVTNSLKTIDDDETHRAMVGRYPPPSGGAGGPPLNTTLPPVINYRRQHINLNRKSRASQTRRKR